MNTRTDTKSAETFITHRGHQTKFQTSSYNGHLPSLLRYGETNIYFALSSSSRFTFFFPSKLPVFNNIWPIRNGAVVA